ncbi:Transferases, transferring hexosyl groups isoform 1 [Theobroma cacao]|uniref:GPI mannosyltransferase 2 n=1 Tax=Theobroma cacao TaxID=3641 RepID=A0A061GYU3_THECC|nr:Transferases, transferring hexosyl groups isoform 1 [Theobroma cacao]
MASPSKPPSEQLLNNSHQTKVLKSAILSRLLLLILTLLWRTLLTPYDTSAPLNPACLNNPSPSPPPPPLLPSLASAIENGIVWDSVYFVRIAQCGYEYEQSYAFLPLLPACIFILSRTVFAPVVLLIGHRAVLALSGYVISNVAFIFAAIYFYRLSVIVLKDPNAALQASVLFCFNPASIFYSSIYSESLYALFSVGGLYYLKSRANNIAVFWLALSGFARSNGVLNAGYFGFQTMHQAYDAAFLKKRAFLALWILISGALRCICIFVPFITFQAYGYYNICLERSSDEMRPWCKARIPLLYNYIQSYYWGMGFLRYFQLKQLPNFLLASPILSLAVCSIIYYVKSRPEIVLSLGFRASVEEKSSMAAIFSLKKSHRSNGPQISEKYSSRRQENHNLKLRKITSQGRGAAEFIIDHGSSEKLGYASASILPFILHLSFMVATAFFVMHVQVATRFLSASPSVYWFASLLMTCPSMSKRWGYMIWAYSCAYILLGSLLFSNFYPFT